MEIHCLAIYLKSTSQEWKTGKQPSPLGSSEIDPSPRYLQSDMSEMGTKDVDILSSRFNNKLCLFVARTKNPSAIASDVLVIPWSQFRLIEAFPLVQILPCLLKKSEKERKTDFHCTKLA